MPNRILILVILFPVIFFSCDSAIKRNKPEKLFRLSLEINKKDIPTKNELNHFYRFYQVHQDTLFVYNQVKHGLHTIDLLSGESSFIPFSFNGLDHIDQVRTFYFHNKDSVFVREESGSIALVNWKGGLKNRYLIDKGTAQSKLGDLYQNAPDPDFSNHLLYNPERKSVYFYFQNFNEVKKKKILAEYSLETGKFIPLPVHYTPHYKDTKFGGALFSTSATIHKGGLAILFSGDPTVTYLDFDSHESKQHLFLPGWEKEFAAPLPLPHKPLEGTGFHDFVRMNPFYGKIMYDPYRKWYYRIGIPPQPDRTEVNFNVVEQNEIHISVYNENFEGLGNISLPKKDTYFFVFSFVTTEGIWIAYNPNHQSDDNVIQGDLIKININQVKSVEDS